MTGSIQKISTSLQISEKKNPRGDRMGREHRRGWKGRKRIPAQGELVGGGRGDDGGGDDYCGGSGDGRGAGDGGRDGEDGSRGVGDDSRGAEAAAAATARTVATAGMAPRELAHRQW